MKLSVLALVALSFLSAGLAQADWCEVIHSPGICDGMDEITAAPLALSLGTTLWLGTTTFGANANRVAYIQAVQDDAAAYLAGADESALLMEAIQALRTEKGITGTDAEIAAQLISE